jgi:glycosyltransferase involved in cell wall biosynthesis
VARRSGTADRVLVLVTSDRRRGAEVFGEQLTGGLLSSGWAAELVSLAGTGLDPRVSADVLARQPADDLGRLDLGAVLALRRKVQDWKPEVLLANGGATLRHAVAALAAMRNPPLLLYASIGEPEYWIRSPRHRTIQRMLLNRVDLVLAVSEATRAQLIEYVGVPADRITVAYTGVPDELASIESAPADGSFRVLFLGNLSREKNPAGALHAFKMIRKQANARLRFVGGGPLETELRHLSATMSQNDAVEFVGPVEDVSPHLAWADVLLLPSITEGLPGAVLEAGAASVPTVAYDVGGTGEAIIDGETGILVTAGDVRGLAKQLLLLDADRGLLSQMGAAARTRVVKEFLIETSVRRYEEILNQSAPRRERLKARRSRTATSA